MGKFPQQLARNERGTTQGLKNRGYRYIYVPPANEWPGSIFMTSRRGSARRVRVPLRQNVAAAKLMGRNRLIFSRAEADG